MGILSRFRVECYECLYARRDALFELTDALADLPVVLVGRLRSDRVMLRDPGPARSGPKGGRPRRHGGVLTFAKPDSWHQPDATTSTDITRYGKAETIAWDRMHPRLTHRGPWLDHAKEELPVLHGTLVRLQVEHLPGDRDPKPVWLWCSATAATPVDVDRRQQSLLRRFDPEHTFRLLKQTLGWTDPKVRHADSADLWTWLIIAAHTQLRLARPLVEDLRRPWERPAEPRRLTPARVRRGCATSARRRPVRQPHRNRPSRARDNLPAREQAPGQAPRRRQDGRTRRVDQRTPSPPRINAKLRCSFTMAARVAQGETTRWSCPATRVTPVVTARPAAPGNRRLPYRGCYV